MLPCVIAVFQFFSLPSTGGSVTAGLGIYDTMQYVQPPISTWCVGQACSMASLLLCAGEKGMRHSLPNSRVMVHQPSGQASVSSCFLLIIMVTHKKAYSLNFFFLKL